MRYQIDEYYPDDEDSKRADAKKRELARGMIESGCTICPDCKAMDTFFIDASLLDLEVECDECCHEAILRDVLEAG